MGRSTPWLGGLAIAYVAAFFLVRSQSGFLRVEAEAAALRAVARQHGLEPAAVFALKEQAEASETAAAFAARVGRFAALRRELGDELAAVAAAGGEAAARRVLEQHGGDPAAAWRAWQRDPAALAGVRWRLMRARFAARAAAMD